MFQRTTTANWILPLADPKRLPPTGRPRLLIENANGALRYSDFSAFRSAGFEVAICSGPESSEECPLVRGGPCVLVAGADVVMFGLDLSAKAGRAVLESLRTRYPATPVLVEVPRDAVPDDLPNGCIPLPFPASVDEQVRVARKALADLRQYHSSASAG